MFKIKKAFTLVEMVVVMVIIGILSTIGVMSYTGFQSTARDAKRISDLEAIQEGLNSYRIKHILPTPTSSVNVSIDGEVVGIQGYVGENVLETINASSDMIDPKDWTYYSYYLNKNGKYFQLMAFMENEGNYVVSLKSKVNAIDYSKRIPYVIGDKLGILTDENNNPISSDTNITSDLATKLKSHFRGTKYVEGDSNKYEEFKKLLDIDKVGGREWSVVNNKFVKNIYCAEGSTDETFFTFNSITQTITDYSDSGPKNVIIPCVISGIVVKYIGERAFWDNDLIDVILPDSIIDISTYGFGRNKLTSVIIPDSVVNIGFGAFFENTLTSVIIPNGIIGIGNYAFYGNKLTSVIIPNTLTSIGSSVFYGNKLTSVIIPNSVTSIGGSAFSANDLTNVIIPNSVTSIGNSSFRRNSLTSVIIPNSVTSIGGSAFSANDLTNVIIPDSVISIGDYAFSLNDLISVIIPNSVTSIGSYAFYYQDGIGLVVHGPVNGYIKDSWDTNINYIFDKTGGNYIGDQ